MAKAATTDLATRQPAGELAPLGYAISEVDPASIVEMLAENTGESSISEFDLDRVKVPAGGATTWAVPSLEGEEELKTIEGVIVYQRTVRSFWAQRMEESGGGSPPDCSSADGLVGIGQPKLGDIEHPDLANGMTRYTAQGEARTEGHFICKACPLAAFGSGGNGRSQACKQSRLIFILRENSVLPLLIAAPPSSLRSIKQYMLRLSGAGVPFYGVVTGFTLQRAKNADNIQYSEIIPTLARRLPPEDTQRMRAVSQALGPILAAVSAEAEQDPSARAAQDLVDQSDADRQAFLAEMRSQG